MLRFLKHGKTLTNKITKRKLILLNINMATNGTVMPGLNTEMMGLLQEEVAVQSLSIPEIGSPTSYQTSLFPRAWKLYG